MGFFTDVSFGCLYRHSAREESMWLTLFNVQLNRQKGKANFLSVLIHLNLVECNLTINDETASQML